MSEYGSVVERVLEEVKDRASLQEIEKYIAGMKPERRNELAKELVEIAPRDDELAVPASWPLSVPVETIRYAIAMRSDDIRSAASEIEEYPHDAGLIEGRVRWIEDWLDEVRLMAALLAAEDDDHTLC